MKAGLFFVVVLTISLMFGQVGTAGEISRDALDQLWEKHMLEGRGGHYMDGQPEVVTTPPIPFVKERTGKGAGSPFAMLSTEYAISVKDFRGTKLFGLLRGGGWTLHGGLLERIEIDAAAIELYGKVINRIYPGLLDHYYRPKEDRTYEFFLLQRKQGVPQAAILKKWVIKPNAVHWFIPKYAEEAKLPERIKKQQETTDVRGFLKYLPESQEAEVTISGLTHLFVERIKVTLE